MHNVHLHNARQQTDNVAIASEAAAAKVIICLQQQRVGMRWDTALRGSEFKCILRSMSVIHLFPTVVGVMSTVLTAPPPPAASSFSPLG